MHFPSLPSSQPKRDACTAPAIRRRRRRRLTYDLLHLHSMLVPRLLIISLEQLRTRLDTQRIGRPAGRRHRYVNEPLFPFADPPPDDDENRTSHIDCTDTLSGSRTANNNLDYVLAISNERGRVQCRERRWLQTNCGLGRRVCTTLTLQQCNIDHTSEARSGGRGSSRRTR